MTISETGSFVESIICTVVVDVISDTGEGTDSALNGLFMGISDVGSGTDPPVEISVELTISDSGLGVDDSFIPSKEFGVTDTGEGSETVGATYSIPVSDTGEGTDVPVVDYPEIVITDSGHGVDAISVEMNATISDAFEGNEFDFPELTYDNTFSDTGEGVEVAVRCDEMFTIVDSGEATEALPRDVEHVFFETGVGSEEIIIGKELSISDSGSGDDVGALFNNSALNVQETGSGSDVVSYSVNITVSDSGSATESVGIVLTLAVVDAGIGHDVWVSGFISSAIMFELTAAEEVAFELTAQDKVECELTASDQDIELELFASDKVEFELTASEIINFTLTG